MAVLLQTTLGELTIDLFIDEVPLLAANFLKLCKLKFYNNSLFHCVEKNFIARGGLPWDPSVQDTDNKSPSIFSLMQKNSPHAYADIVNGSCKEPLYSQAQFNHDTGHLHECFHPRLRHRVRGTISMANDEPNCIGSAFFVTLRDSIDYLDNCRSVIGTVTEGFEVLDAINATLVECQVFNRPLCPIRILHTLILDDPFPDPPGLFPGGQVPLSPLAVNDEPAEDGQDGTQKTDIVESEIAAFERIARSEAKSRAVALEILGDLPDADLAPPDNVLFVCKLNPITEAEDLELIFSRFGKIISCDIIRDWKTGDSLQYGFIEYESPKSCEAALFKMEGCLIDDRRIHVDFCQSVSKQWAAFRRFGPRQGKDADDSISQVDSKPGYSGRRDRNRQYEFLFDTPHTVEATVAGNETSRPRSVSTRSTRGDESRKSYGSSRLTGYRNAHQWQEPSASPSRKSRRDQTHDEREGSFQRQKRQHWMPRHRSRSNSVEGCRHRNKGRLGSPAHHRSRTGYTSHSRH